MVELAWEGCAYAMCYSSIQKGYSMAYHTTMIVIALCLVSYHVRVGLAQINATMQQQIACSPPFVKPPVKKEM